MLHTLLRLPAVKAQSGYSRSTIYLRISHGLWTKPVSLGARAVAWPAGGAALVPETPAQRSARLQARKAVLQQQGVKAFLPVIAQEERISVSMVKRILGRAPEPAAPAFPSWAAALAPPAGVSAGSKRKR